MPRVFVPDDQLEDPKDYVFANYATKLTKAGLRFSSTVYLETQLPFRIVEAARIRTAQLNGCKTCQTWRSKRDLPAAMARKGGDASQSFINRGDPEPDEAFYAAIEGWQTASELDDR